MASIFNPGEPVIDQETGEPYIDPATGDWVEVQPNLQVPTEDDRTLDGDDVANAAWYRANLYQSEAPRDATRGVPYQQLVFDPGNDVGLAATLVVSTVRTETPGVAGVAQVRIETYDATDRSLRFSARVVKADGSSQQTTVLAGGVGA